MNRLQQKVERLEQVNALVTVISTYGRRFFYNATNDRIAQMVIGKGGHLYWVDDYTRKPIYIAREDHWRYFSHGGTLRDLVKRLAQYVRDGKPLPLDWIGPKRNSDGSNIWGYAAEEMEKCRAAALGTGVIAPEGENHA